jgi:hypothetical protein
MSWQDQLVLRAQLVCWAATVTARCSASIGVSQIGDPVTKNIIPHSPGDARESVAYYKATFTDSVTQVFPLHMHDRAP